MRVVAPALVDQLAVALEGEALEVDAVDAGVVEGPLDDLTGRVFLLLRLDVRNGGQTRHVSIR